MIPLMEEILHQLRLVVYPIIFIYGVSYMLGDAGVLSSTVFTPIPKKTNPEKRRLLPSMKWAVVLLCQEREREREP